MKDEELIRWVPRAFADDVEDKSLLMATPLEIFDEAVSRVTQQRGVVYGHPSVDFDRVARLKAVTAECQDPCMRHVLDMICVKIARLIHTPDHLDSLIDIAGYARTGAMLQTEDN